jgi:hypothetical protein
VLDRGEGEAPVPPSKPAMMTLVGARFRHARGHRADADFGNQLDRNLTVRLTFLRS